MKRKNILILLGTILMLILLSWYFTQPSAEQGQTIKTDVVLHLAGKVGGIGINKAKPKKSVLTDRRSLPV